MVLNFSKLAAMCGLDKDSVKTALFHIISRIAEVIRDNYVVMLEFNKVGVFYARNGTVDFVFNIGKLAHEREKVDYAVGDGNPTFMSKAPSSAIGLKLEGLASEKFSAGESAPELPPELTPRALAALEAEINLNAYHDPRDLAAVLRERIAATEVAIEKEREAFKHEVLEQQKLEQSQSTSRKVKARSKSPPKEKAATSRPRTSSLNLSINMGEGMRPATTGLKGKAATHLPGLNLAALEQKKKPWSVFPVYINPVKEPPRGRKTDPIQFDAAQEKSYASFQQSLFHEIEELDKQDLELERRRKLSEALYREKVLRRKNAQTQMNKVLAIQKDEKEKRDYDQSHEDFQIDFSKTRVLPQAINKTKPQIAAEKNVLKNELFHQMNIKHKGDELETRLVRREDQFFINCVKEQLADDRRYRAAKKKAINDDLKRTWDSQLQLKAVKDGISAREQGKISVVVSPLMSPVRK